jgi:hypothetical protein
MSDQNLTVICPKCKEKISIEEALGQQIKEKISANAKQEAKLALAGEIKYLEEENKKKEAELEKAQKNELELRKERNLLSEQKRSWDIEKQRQLDQEREKIRESTARELLEKQRFKDEENNKVISDLKKALAEAQIKASQGSQQTQGEVQELNLEKELRSNFPTDEIEEIKKGERGADIRQTVKTAKGNVCGVILWESKQTKAWSDGWINKLKEDLRTEKANIPVIVTTVMPKDSKNPIYVQDGVWICTFSFAVILADLMRQRLIEVAREKFIVRNQETKAGEIYSYIMSHEFRQQIEAVIEAYVNLKNGLMRERRAYESIWKARDEQLEKIIKSTARAIGPISGKTGSEFPQLKGLDLLESGS